MKLTSICGTAALIAFLAGAPCLALACGADESAIHTGRLLSLDKAAGNFTLLDAETMSPITLTADAALLERVSSMLYHAYQNEGDGVVVTYEDNGDELRALTLE